mgnify:CR=1 FL=1
MLLPLKQGLKLLILIHFKLTRNRCYATSIKTRIETLKIKLLKWFIIVVMLLPLKQGLKLHHNLKYMKTVLVVMLLPLKQGLKLILISGGYMLSSGCYATSIKTRIETPVWCCLDICKISCYATSIKTRIETIAVFNIKVNIYSCYATSIKTRIETIGKRSNAKADRELLCYFH